MKAIQRAVFVASVGLMTWLALCVPAGAQSVRIDGGVVSRSTFGFYWETRLEPPVPGLGNDFSTSTTDGPGAIHRIMVDRARRVYFGYDVVVEPLPEANTYRVAFQQLVTTPELAKRLPKDTATGWAQLPAPAFPAAQTIRGGDVLALNLLTNGATGQKIVDYVTVQEPTGKFDGFQKIPAREFAFAPGSPRDFRADDAELRIVSPRLTVNGKLDESSVRRYDTVAGAVVWLYVGNRGRYYLSLMPHPELGFRKVGEVRGSSLSFTIGADTFTLSSAGRIAPGQAPFNLYVLHDPAWRPTYANANLSAFNMGAADRADSLIRK
jgi:hypothetical protein